MECHFTALTQFVFGNADYLDWDAANWAHARHTRHRNGLGRDRRLAELDSDTGSLPDRWGLR
jgi:hypothetical protein